MVWLTGESNVKYMLGRAAFDQLMKLLGFHANFSSGQILENIVYLLYTLGIDASKCGKVSCNGFFNININVENYIHCYH